MRRWRSNLRRGVLVGLRPDGSVVAGLPEIPASALAPAAWLSLRTKFSGLVVDLRLVARECECLDVNGRVLLRYPLRPLKPSRRARAGRRR